MKTYKSNYKLVETINNEKELFDKLKPLSELDILSFMSSMKAGAYFNMGMYSVIPVAKTYKNSICIVKVLDLTAIVSGVSYENIEAVRDYRQQTQTTASSTWYEHQPGLENKVGYNKRSPQSKYVLWNAKSNSKPVARYFIVDLITKAVTAVSKQDVLGSKYLTASEIKKLQPVQPVGINTHTGQLVTNSVTWRTAAFEHIFYLNQADVVLGTRFVESANMKEAVEENGIIDAHSNVPLGTVDAFIENTGVFEEELVEAADQNDIKLDVIDAHADVPMGTVDKVISKHSIHEQYNTHHKYKVHNDSADLRRPVSTPLIDDDFFINF